MNFVRHFVHVASVVYFCYIPPAARAGGERGRGFGPHPHGWGYNMPPPAEALFSCQSTVKQLSVAESRFCTIISHHEDINERNLGQCADAAGDCVDSQ